MLWTAIKLGAVTVGSAALVGGMLFGADLVSYVRSSANSVSVAVKDSIPLDFQLQRARDLLNETGPEMEHNVRVMAEQEVDIASLRTEIGQAQQSIGDEKVRLAKLSDDLSTTQISFTFGDFTYSRDQLVQELSRRFTDFKQAEQSLTQKQDLLLARQKALAAAEQAMDAARGQRANLESELEELDARNHLVQETAVATGSDLQLDRSKLAQAGKVVDEVRHQLDISERMLAEEARFTRPIEINVTDEKQLVTEVNAHLNGQTPTETPVAGDVLSDAGHGVK